MKESLLQRSILEYLAVKRVLAFRMNTGALTMGTRFIRFGVPGMADILAFPHIVSMAEVLHTSPVLWIECKTGTKQSQLQKSFQQQVELYGHRYIVARSIEDVEAVL